MNNEFDVKAKKLEQEILDIKTASEYSLVKSANITSNFMVSTGLYEITYQNNEIIALAFCTGSIDERGSVYLRTPNKNVQILEVNTNYISGGSVVTGSALLTIISNSKVESITRL